MKNASGTLNYQGATGCPFSTCRALAIACLRRGCPAWIQVVASHAAEQDPDEGVGAVWKPGLHLTSSPSGLDDHPDPHPAQ